MDCEVLKLFIILHELLENSKINVNSRIKPSELKKKLKTQGKNSKLKRKTQFFGIFICWPRGKDGQTKSLYYIIMDYGKVKVMPGETGKWTGAPRGLSVGPLLAATRTPLIAKTLCTTSKASNRFLSILR